MATSLIETGSKNASTQEMLRSTIFKGINTNNNRHLLEAVNGFIHAIMLQKQQINDALLRAALQKKTLQLKELVEKLKKEIDNTRSTYTNDPKPNPVIKDLLNKIKDLEFQLTALATLTQQITNLQKTNMSALQDQTGLVQGIINKLFTPNNAPIVEAFTDEYQRFMNEHQFDFTEGLQEDMADKTRHIARPAPSSQHREIDEIKYELAKLEAYQSHARAYSEKRATGFVDLIKSASSKPSLSSYRYAKPEIENKDAVEILYYIQIREVCDLVTQLGNQVKTTAINTSASYYEYNSQLGIYPKPNTGKAARVEDDIDNNQQISTTPSPKTTSTSG